MDIINSMISSTHSIEHPKNKVEKSPDKAKNTKELQQQAIEQAQISKAKKEETKKSETTKEKEEIRQEIAQLASKLNDEIAPLSNDIRFGYSDEIDQMLVNVVDANTGEVLRQFPSEEAIEIMTKMKELIGMLFDKKG